MLNQLDHFNGSETCIERVKNNAYGDATLYTIPFGNGGKQPCVGEGCRATSRPTLRVSQQHNFRLNTMDEDVPDVQDVAQETPADNVFVPPSIHKPELFAGQSYSHYSAVPQTITADIDTECVLGVDEAGRGPVLGVYLC